MASSFELPSIIASAMSCCSRTRSARSAVSAPLQHLALLENFRRAVSLPMCPVLLLGVEDVVVQFGPLVVDGDGLVMLCAVLTDRHGRFRVFDHLAPDEVPHLTVGRLASGGGWVECCDSRCVLYRVAESPRVVPDCSTLEWSRDVRCVVNMSRLVDDIAASPIFELPSREPSSASVFVDWDSHRFVIVGGDALRFYREVQRLVARHFADLGAGHAFDLWAQSDDVVEFKAHISSRYDGAPSASAAPVSSDALRVSGDTPCTSCWTGLSRLWSSWRISRDEDSGISDGQLSLFVTRQAFPELVGRALSRPDAFAAFDRWRAFVAEDRRCGSSHAPSVRVLVESDSIFPSTGVQLFIFVTEQRFVELIGSAVSPAEASGHFERWYGSVPAERRWGSADEPSVIVLVDGVPFPGRV